MLGALISAGSSLLGGFMASKQADKQAKLQKQFAKNAVSWKVQDAKNAGVHPLYALGAQTVSYTPQAVGDLGISQAGQDIGRAIDTSLSGRERMSALSARAAALQLENMELQNTKLASEIKLVNQAGTPPAPINEEAIIDGQGNSTITAKEFSTIMNPSNPQAEPAARPDVMFTRHKLPNGHYGYAVNPSTETAEAMESNPVGQFQFMVRNGLKPWMTQAQTQAPPVEWLPPGYNRWKFDFGDGMWKPEFRIPAHLSGRYNIRSKGTM